MTMSALCTFLQMIYGEALKQDFRGTSQRVQRPCPLMYYQLLPCSGSFRLVWAKRSGPALALSWALFSFMCQQFSL
jgi:hypothetical protein